MSVLLGIVSKNRKDLLVKAINSGYLQKGVEVNISVVDDASNDGTRSIAKDFPLVNWIWQKEERGYLVGRNMLMKESEQEFYCSLDDDSWFLEEDALRLAVDIMVKDPEVACVAFDILSPERPISARRSSPISTANYIGCGHLLRLSAVREAGYYNPNPLRYGGEEKDMCLGLLNLGYSIKFLPGVHVWHAKTMIGRDMAKQHMESLCNDLVITFRRSPLVFLPALLPYKMLSHAVFSLRYDGGKYWSAYLRGIKKFIQSMIRFRLDRKPVTISTYLKFIQLLRVKAA